MIPAKGRRTVLDKPPPAHGIPPIPKRSNNVTQAIMRPATR